ncbi:OLC1v1033770C1 [Oldenlandia corymbosa var. corymbosa]|uniref:OLC1v1033770C1 n=1 Tax=Oldenlandia corymbosa var. corymbosa TaxID=529605 RepID=A0AAV1CQA8_OLDCO|nr:OLC1v1033770C1 [Oldenlandia corymbosa var. corymbosa]
MEVMRRRRLMGLGFGTFFAFSIIFLQSPMLILAGNQPDDNNDLCAERKCSPDGPAVRFPFVLREKQPQYCGYNSGFNLHCYQSNRTILELPSSSIKVKVTNISYSSQMIEVRFVETCFAKHLSDLDISTTPFSYPSPDSRNFFYEVGRYSLFNCSSMSREYESQWVRIDCLGHHRYKVYAANSSLEVRDRADSLESCTKMYDTKSVSSSIFYTGSMELIWSLPLCRKCESRGGICRWKKGSRSLIDCLGGNKHHSGILQKLLISGPIIGCLLLILAISAIRLAYSAMKVNREDQRRLKKFLQDYAAMQPTRYSYAEIKRITSDFKDKLGEGGYGNVYKGKVSNNIYVAVKVLHSSADNGEEFINEVGIIGRIHHVNVVRLLGFCADGYERALVYEFLPNGSLDKFIFPDDQEHHTLGMERLQDIALGIARGIEYLHQGCEQRILHFDIKPHNILLDENYNPKISDFGLAKMCEKGKSEVSMTAARGTMGYIAPEVFSRHFGNVSYKSDIYSFGMLLLEMVGKRKNINADAQNISQVYFPEWIYGRLTEGEDLRIQVDDKEDGEYKIGKKLAIVGLWCIQWNPVNRPSIKSVLQMLEGIGEDHILPPNPFVSGKAGNPEDRHYNKQLGDKARKSVFMVSRIIHCNVYRLQFGVHFLSKMKWITYIR